MSGAKIQLSTFETELVQNSEWILTKRTIIDKVYALFGALSAEYVSIVHSAKLPDEIRSIGPKISRGENYHGLPYVMLDYPRVFDKENVFAIRTLFWWGNFFSSTFHLKGKYKELFADKISMNNALLKEKNYAFGIGDDEWDFRFDESNFKMISEMAIEEWNEYLRSKKIVRLSAKIPLIKWDMATENLLDYFRLHLEAAAINYRDGETDLSPGNPTTGFGL